MVIYYNIFRSLIFHNKFTETPMHHKDIQKLISRWYCQFAVDFLYTEGFSLRIS